MQSRNKIPFEANLSHLPRELCEKVLMLSGQPMLYIAYIKATFSATFEKTTTYVMAVQPMRHNHPDDPVFSAVFAALGDKRSVSNARFGDGPMCYEFNTSAEYKSFLLKLDRQLRQARYHLVELKVKDAADLPVYVLSNVKC